MNKNEIILVGGGGHCKSCIDVIESQNKFTITGIIDLPQLLGSEALGYKVIGNDHDLPKFIKQGYQFLITMGHMGNAERRNNLYEFIKSHGGSFPTVISPSAHVSRHAQIKPGTIVMHNAIINAESSIGENCIINNQALIEHNSIIGDHCHISTGAIINGNVDIKSNAFIGSGALIKNGISIVSQSIIGMGAVVVQNIENSGTFYGNPARKK